MSRPHLIGSAALALVVGATSACGTSGPGEESGGGSEGGLEVWALEDATVNPIVQQGIEQFNESSDVSAELTTYVNDAYKQKLQVAMGSPNAPDVFFNWGGGNLAQYVNSDQVVNLSPYMEDDPELRESFLPSVLDVAEIDGEYYGVPMLGVQPIVLFYNKQVFEDAGIEPPETYADLLDAIDTFKEQDIIPVSLAGAQGWTELMWLEYLTDRLGGKGVFDAIAAGEEGSWQDPALLEALSMCRDLAERGAFGSNFSSIDYDNGSASSLLASGKAAMMLMGTWELGTQTDRNPEFVESGNFAYTDFPTMEDGEGEPNAIVGNPSNYFSINSDTENEEAAVDFLTNTVTSDQYVEGLIEAGQVPAVEGIEDQFSSSDTPEFSEFTYNLVSDAPSFTQSWDQAVDPATAEAMLTNLQQVFLGDTTPEEFGEAMEQQR
ncbi:ABC transporter substrate-binding protein [Salinactinospora qingdaonensis]